MHQRVLILGAKGRFGRHAIHAFSAAGWQVTGMARNWPNDVPEDAIKRIKGNAFNSKTIIQAGEGCDVIVNALNPPYERWNKEVPRLTRSVIAAAKTLQATVLIPGNVYSYGETMPSVLTEKTRRKPSTRKGKLRDQMEEAYAVGEEGGIQTIILRAGDFMERTKTGNWFESYIAADLAKGVATYPGPLDCVHAWTYLPDMARAMVCLAEKRDTLEGFDEFGMGINLTGAELLRAMEDYCDQPLKVRKMPWGVMKILAVFVPKIREVLEMRYLWDVPHAIDNTKLAQLLPDFQSTPLDRIMDDVLADIIS